MATPLACRTGRALRYAVLSLALVILPSVASAAQYAILISGFDDDTSTQPPGSPGFLADLSHVYLTLLHAGYPSANIQVLCAQGGAHDLGDGHNDVTGKCESQADVDQAFQALAGKVQAGDVVVFFATGHGMSAVMDSKSYPNTYVCTYKCLDKIWDYEVANDFKTLDDAMGAGTVRKICLVVPCHSGGFILSSSFAGKPSNQDLAGLKSICAATAVRYDQGSEFDTAKGYPLT